jgi:preprotein translocase subunit SecA
MNPVKTLSKLLGDPNAREINRVRKLAGLAGEHEAAIRKLSDKQLREQTAKFKERLAKGEKLDALLPEAFATVREASQRANKQRHFDVQLMGGAVLHEGKIAEMRTGEGKTLTSTAPIYLNALEGKGVHVVTVNDYLARRDAGWMARIYYFLGLSTGVIISSQGQPVGYLYDPDFSDPDEHADERLKHLRPVTRREAYEADALPIFPYTIDEKEKRIAVTDEGMAKLEKILGVENVYESGAIDDVHHIQQSVRAEALYMRDRDYVVRDGEIIIVDEFTGRLMPGRRWSEGLHQAVEAKEGVAIQRESLTLATISFQNYFRLYDKLAGMTGTAATEAEEFAKIYELEVTTIPTHRPMVRRDHADRIYKTEAGKFRAIAAEVKERNQAGQPVLLGTVSIAKNELLSAHLKAAGVPHEVLNAKNNEREAAIVAQAGQKGAVTLATNIAGRGTDIVLGEGVADLGGLHVVGTERHESRRIDNQLRGRSGRQGDPGSSRFYVSLEDDLMRIFGGDRVAGLMNTLGLDEDMPLENPIVSRSLESAQKKVEGHNFDIRKQLVEYDDVMNKHREVIYTRRRQALEHANLRPEIEKMLADSFAGVLTAHTDQRTGVMETDKVIEIINAGMPLDQETVDKIKNADPRDASEILVEYAQRLYDAREQQFTPEGMRVLERLVYLQTLDRLWIEHLDAMDGLREGIGLRAIGQRDPLVEYKAEGFRMIKRLVDMMESEIAGTIFRASIQRQDTPAEVDTAMTRAAEQASTNAPDGNGANRAQRRARAEVIGNSSKTKRKRKKKRR